jgi:hypothetical protein
VAVDAYQLVREALVPVPTEKGVELMAQWQAMDLRFVNEVVAELGQK